MRMAVASLLLVAPVLVGAQRQASNVDAAFRAFWSAETVERRATAAAGVLASGASYDDLAKRLKGGREYRPARTGRVNLPTGDRGLALDNVLDVPADYVPSRSWPLRVALHGGVGRPAPGPNDPPARPLSNRIPIAGELVLHPRAWSGSEWWTAGQVENIAKLVDRV